jgi:hypothetical protein
VNVHFKAGDLTITADAFEHGSHASLSTGHPLAVMRVRFDAHTPEDKRLVGDFIESGQPVELGSPATRWRVGEHSSSYVDGSPLTTFIWELREVEELKIDHLLMADLEVKPYRYKEDFDQKGVLTIDCRVELSESDEKRLRNWPTYFLVVRKGINDSAREMRFGMLLWSKKESDDKYRMSVILVDKAYDKPPILRGFLEPQFTNQARRVAVSRLWLTALIDKLTSKGILTADEAEQIRTINEHDLKTEFNKLFSVDDLDEWLGD